MKTSINKYRHLPWKLAGLHRTSSIKLKSINIGMINCLCIPKTWKRKLKYLRKMKQHLKSWWMTWKTTSIKLKWARNMPHFLVHSLQSTNSQRRKWKIWFRSRKVLWILMQLSSLKIKRLCRRKKKKFWNWKKMQNYVQNTKKKTKN